MKIQDQVCTLEQAKRLKELGINQQSHYSWDLDNVHGWRVKGLAADVLNSNSRLFELVESAVSAFTVAELGVMLGGKEHYLPYFTGKVWQRMTKKRQYTNITITGESEGEARAAMLIHLLTNNHSGLTPDEVNQRLTA